MKQVICISWGPKYGAPYVNRLYAGVARHLTPPFSFTCFTDDAAGFRAEIRAEPLPPLDVAMPTGTKGIWPKARLWSAELADLEGPVLFMDLDLVVVGALDGFFSFGDSDEVILARNPTTPLERLGQTSIFRFPVGKLLPLQEKFLADPQGVADAYQFEQRFVTREAPGGDRVLARALGAALPPALRAGAAAQLLPAAADPEGRARGHLPRRPPAAARDRRALGAAVPADVAGRAPARPLRRRPARPAAALPAPLPAAGALGRRGVARVARDLGDLRDAQGMHNLCTTHMHSKTVRI